MSKIELISATTDRLERLETPMPTETWTPVPHAKARQYLVDAIRGKGLTVMSERIELSADERRAIGHLSLGACEDGTWRMEAIWWNDHLKLRGLTYLGGERVFACTNGCVWADCQLRLKRDARQGYVLPRARSLADRLVSRLLPAAERNMARRDALSRELIGPEYARSLTVRMAEAGIVPSSKILPVVAEFEQPSFEYKFNPRSLLGLQSAVTHALKAYNSITQSERSGGLTEFLDNLVSV